MSKKLIITIARQYGSGGREIGNRVAELLGVPLYDKEIITDAAAKGSLNEEVIKKVDGRTLIGNKARTAVSDLSKLESDCYVCSRIGKNITAMTATAVYLFESDSNFVRKFKKAPYFCLPHYKKMIDYAEKKMPKKIFRDFYDTAHGIEAEYLKALRGDVSWFCKKFDYRYDEEPWYNSKDSVQRAERFLSGELGYEL